MGLDVSHDCWSGPYSAFMRFRQALARKAGIPLDLMDWYYAPGAGENGTYWPVTTVDVESKGNFDWPDSDYRSEGLEEFLSKRPDYAAWHAQAVASGHPERRYTVTYIDRNRGHHEYEVAEIPSGPPVTVPNHIVSALEWARAKGPNGPDSGSHLSPSLERFVVDVASWLPLSWDLFPIRREPLTVLLRHSDCEGVIYVRHQRRLADRLDELADLFPPRFGGHHDWTPDMEPRAIYDGVGEAARRFAAGLRDAYSRRETVTFG